MQIRFLLGPAGSGKTFRCLAEIRAALLRAPAGTPLLMLAPKQATFQLERQLLAEPELPGYTRLQILSFDRLAEFILAQFAASPARLLSDEGRLMVLRALLARKHSELKLFRATARLPGFATELSRVLSELRRHRLSPERLIALAENVNSVPQLSDKLHDLALMLRAYLDWLRERDLEDADGLLDLAANTVRQANRESPLLLSGLWLDGFAEMTPQELALLAALVPCCQQSTLAFCLENAGNASWLSTWSVISQTFRRCYDTLADIPGSETAIDVVERDPARSRFTGNPVLAHLEEYWSQPRPIPNGEAGIASRNLSRSIRVAVCANPEAEATLAAREILRHVRQQGGRYRDIAVLVRNLEGYHYPLRRVFHRYEIPFFLDRRECLAHHPLAELTRSALRMVAFGWKQEDWFGALKTGFANASEPEIDWLENKALEHGWEGTAWHAPLEIEDERLAQTAEGLRKKLVPPFLAFAEELSNNAVGAHAQSNPTGATLSNALRQLWASLGAGKILRDWSQAAPSTTPPAPDLHITVWDQMHEWLDNLEIAFEREALPVREWLPILEAGLSSLTVGVVPPALDQVLIGAIDRSRNPDLQLALVLGMNESVFPAAPAPSSLLTETDRAALEGAKIFLGPDTRHRLGHERFFGYVACTRARQRLVLTCASVDTSERKLNPSPFLGHLQQLFPALPIEQWQAPADWLASEHATELIAPLIKAQNSDPALAGQNPPWQELLSWPVFDSFRESLRDFQTVTLDTSLSSRMAERLYGPDLRTSVTRLEQFANCPFKFFVRSGLRAQEPKLFQVDSKKLGDFQHQVLKLFHDQLRADHKRWHDLEPAEARQQIAQVARTHAEHFHGGLFLARERDRFALRQLTSDLEMFIETIVGWMKQYEFEPAAVELRFHQDGDVPAWHLPLSGGHNLVFSGSIDRVDLLVSPDKSQALCVVVDYKSSSKKIDPYLLENGMQLQLPAYLGVLRRLENPERIFGVKRLIPAGVFYVRLRGQYRQGSHRNEVFTDAAGDRRLAYRHTGRFNSEVLRHLDSRPDIKQGDQFHFRLTNKGELDARSGEPLSAGEFLGLLDQVENQLKQMGEAIFRGDAKVDPYRRTTSVPCEYCDYQSICRIDPWTHTYRALRKPAKPCE